MEEWIHQNLSEVLDFLVSDELIKYIMDMKDERDLEDYLKTLLDYNNIKHRQFITELKKRRASNSNLNQAGYKKVNSADDTSMKQNKKKKGKAKAKEKQEYKQVFFSMLRNVGELRGPKENK